MANSEKNTYVVNGVAFKTKDDLLTGREILQAAGFTPPSDHILIEVVGPGTKSIGLDEKVGLSQPGREIFYAFQSDRIFTFTVDEVGYEWGEAEINESRLRDITRVEESKVLVLERSDAPDQLIEDGSSVNLAARGTERFRTERRSIRIIVNAREVFVTAHELSYAELVALAFNPVPTGPDVLFTITYRKGSSQNPKGTLPEGMSVVIKNGMIFIVTQTNRS